jgi:membrane fusion protein (multidrug efflux system)
VRQAEGRLQEAQTRPDRIRVSHADLEGAVSEIEQARATLRQAELNLSYTKIYATESGYITKKSVEPGNYVQTGQALMALVTDRLWVTANYKEVQLERMRPGQSVTIKIDAYPQRKFNGKVDSIQAGSGARFSLLPPENATGNYVKVVQRVPVKILFTEGLPSDFRIGPGMSVVPEVKVR